MSPLSIAVCVLYGLYVLGIGASVAADDLHRALKKTKFVVTTVILSFVSSGVVAIALYKALGLSQQTFFCLLLIASSPGWVVNKTLMIFLRGEISVVVAATFFANAITTVWIPFVIWLYVELLQPSTETPSLAIVGLVQGVSVVLMFTGVFFRAKFSKLARYFEVTGIFSGLIFICGMIISGMLRYGSQVTAWQDWVSAVLLQLGGFVPGLLFARLFKYTVKDQKAAAIHCGTSNFALAIVLLQLMFDSSAGSEYQTLLPVYAATVPAVGAIFVVITRSLGLGVIIGPQVVEPRVLESPPSTLVGVSKESSFRTYSKRSQLSPTAGDLREPEDEPVEYSERFLANMAALRGDP